jgi:hypothetical protein
VKYINDLQQYHFLREKHRSRIWRKAAANAGKGGTHVNGRLFETARDVRAMGNGRKWGEGLAGPVGCRLAAALTSAPLGQAPPYPGRVYMQPKTIPHAKKERTRRTVNSLFAASEAKCVGSSRVCSPRAGRQSDILGSYLSEMLGETSYVEISD